MLPGFVDEGGIHGVVGARAVVHFAGRFYSPVYGHCEWTRGVQQASCAIGCQAVPGDRHQGCGFHAHWDIHDSMAFVEQIRGTADCLVLIECFGRVAVHEKGLRAERARIVAVVDWDPCQMFFNLTQRVGQAEPSVPLAALRYFGVPLVDPRTAGELIELQRERCLVSA